MASNLSKRLNEHKYGKGGFTKKHEAFNQKRWKIIKKTSFPQDAMPVVEKFKGKITSKKAIKDLFTILADKYHWGLHYDMSLEAAKGFGKPIKPLFTKKSGKELDLIMADCRVYAKKHKIDLWDIAFPIEKKFFPSPSNQFEKGGNISNGREYAIDLISCTVSAIKFDKNPHGGWMSRWADHKSKGFKTPAQLFAYLHKTYKLPKEPSAYTINESGQLEIRQIETKSLLGKSFVFNHYLKPAKENTRTFKSYTAGKKDLYLVRYTVQLKNQLNETSKITVDELMNEFGVTKKAADGTILETLQEGVHTSTTPTEMQDIQLQLAEGGALPEDTTQSQVYDKGGSVLIKPFFEKAGVNSYPEFGEKHREWMKKIIENQNGKYIGYFFQRGFLHIIGEKGVLSFERDLFDGNFENWMPSIDTTVYYQDGGTVEIETKSEIPIIPNNQASVYTAERLPFLGSNLEGKKLLNGDYIVLSFLCYPVWLYSSAENKWYGNKDRINTITAMHQSESRPDFNAEMLSLHDLYTKIFSSMQKFDMGGAVMTLFPLPLDNTLAAHG